MQDRISNPFHGCQNPIASLSLFFIFDEFNASHPKTGLTIKRKATPSFSPGSDVSANLVSDFIPSFGGPTCTSDARTGSVGAITVPSNTADARPKPKPKK